MEKLSTVQIRLALLVLGILLFLPFLGNAPLFDWDEINFAESSREMLVTGNYSRVQINFQPFWEKPPLFFWMQALSMHLFGVNEYAARFPNAVFGIITLLGVFEIGRRSNGKTFGLLWAISLAGSFLPHVYFKSGIIDPVFNCFIFLSIYFLYQAVSANNKSQQALISGAFAGLAVLTKGPVGVLIPILCLATYIALKRFSYFPPIRLVGLWMFAIIVVSFAWFGPETIQNGPWFLEEFISYQIRLLSTPDAGHGQPFYYHFVVILFGCFPISVFAINQFVRGNPGTDPLRFWMKILFWVVMILFSLVTTKIVHYSSLAYLPLAYLAATEFTRLLRENVLISFWQKSLLILTGLLPALSFILLPVVGMHPEYIEHLINDPFAKLNLAAQVHWPWYTFLPGIILFAGIIISIFVVKRMQAKVLIGVLLGCTLVATSLFLIFIPQRIAQYSQGAPVEFYKTMQAKDVYVETLGYKSFAQYFYTRKKGLSVEEQRNSIDKEGLYHIDALRNWLLTGDIDKPAYFVTKTTKEAEYLKHDDLICIGRKNGFSFLYREVP
ncbi:MAG: glycosyltransferase family 39 protein [Bacteroidia bacterium]|nr:glycosyltransferase family 39 protein [Bacteroidia bacterium]